MAALRTTLSMAAYWLIDPLDGTRGFIEHLEQFSINIALIIDHLPKLGVIYSPVSETIYYAWEGAGAYKQVGQDPPQLIQPVQPGEGVPWRIVIGQYSRGKKLENLIQGVCQYQLLHVNGSVKVRLVGRRSSRYLSPVWANL